MAGIGLIFLAAAVTFPPTTQEKIAPDMKIIRMCQDNLQVQLYVWEDAKGLLWYGRADGLGPHPIYQLDEKALDQVCPVAKKGSPA